MDVSYSMMKDISIFVRSKSKFLLDERDFKGPLHSLQHKEDGYHTNWVSGNHPWGLVSGAEGKSLEVKVTRRFTSRGTLEEIYEFRNYGPYDIYTSETEIGICTPFPDYYTDAKTCLFNCCHTHIHCGGSASYVMGFRMNGEGPHLGLVLLEGGLCGYSYDRAYSTDQPGDVVSNRRGDLILHPEAMHLRSGESRKLRWELFWFADREEFKTHIQQVPGFLYVESDGFVKLPGETLNLSVRENEESVTDMHICRDGQPVDAVMTKQPVRAAAADLLYRDAEEDGTDRWYQTSETAGKPGVYRYEIGNGGKHTAAEFLVVPPKEELVRERLRFILEKQQCLDRRSPLFGAFLIYDNEEKHPYYDHENDHNGGRERLGMGVLLALYLQKHPDPEWEERLRLHLDFVLRELFDEATGVVYNDIRRSGPMERLYNSPWFSRYFLELYNLWKEDRFLDCCYRCTKAYYEAGGAGFYGIGMPMEDSIPVFREAGREEQAEELLAWYRSHGDCIVDNGWRYPAHEVAYEQSIVAPAAIYMCELFRLTGDEKYRDQAFVQLQLLNCFQGIQPDYHLNEVAIRHWDGYWFGKRRCLGDTFPHYWSALTGYAFRRAEGINGLEYYAEKGERALRGVLSLYHTDGSATCAMVYPMTVSGRPAHFEDPWANDQDWGLYYWMKYGAE